LNDTSGTFSPPPNVTGKTLYCTWSIEAIAGKRIELTFGKQFYIGNLIDSDCDFSFVKVE